MHPAYRQPLRSQAKAIARRREEERAQRFRRMLAISVMSALTLGAILIAKADWVVINEDGSVTRTETRVQAQVAPNAAATSGNRSRSTADTMQAYDNAIAAGSQTATYQAPNTTFFAGTYYPVPTYGYSYSNPGGVTYPVGPVFPNVPPPMVTTLPSTVSGYGYGYPPAYAYPAVPYYPVPAYPVYGYPAYSYPAYGATGVFYSGPAGGGGTVYSSTTTTGGGYGISIGKKGVRLNLGNTTSSSTSTTTVTTTGSY